jgi:hypothetical protein
VRDSFEQVSHNINGNGILDWIGFVPAYQGMYDEFSSDKDELNSAGLTVDLSQERDEHYMREFRSYYQQPFIWVDKLWKCAKDKIDSTTDYTLVLDQSWFTPSNPYWSDLIYTCPSLFTADDNFSTVGVTFKPKLNIATKNKPSKSPELNQQYSQYIDGFEPWTTSELYDNGIFNPNGDLGATKFQGNFRFTMFAALDGQLTDIEWGRLRNNNPFYIKFEAVNADTGLPIYGASETILFYSDNGLHWTYGQHDSAVSVDVCNILIPDITVPENQRDVLWPSSPNYGQPHSVGDGYWWEVNLNVSLNVLEDVPYKIAMSVYNSNNSDPFECSSVNWFHIDTYWTDFFQQNSVKDNGYSVYLDVISASAETVEHLRSRSILNLYRIFPKDVTLRDVLLNYSKMCGLVWDVDEDNKRITVMPRNRFFQDYRILDWDEKVDRTQPFKLEPLTFKHKYVIYNYKEGECGRLKSYESRFENTYGAKRLDTGYDFNSDETELFKELQSSIVCQKKQFSRLINTDDETQPDFMGYGYKVTPAEHYIDNDDEGSNAGMSGAFYFRNGTFAPDSQLSYTDAGGAYILVSDDTSYQVQSGEYCWNSSGENAAICHAIPDVSTISKEYNGKRYSVHFAKPAEYYIPVSGDIRYLYASYWESYINERYCSQNKKLTAYFYINTKEFNDLDFREFIKLDNVLYHIDKVYDYNLNSSKSVKMDLSQVWDTANYISGQYSLPYLYTVPYTATLSPTNTTDYDTVDVYCSGQWRVVPESVPSWIDCYKSGNDLMIKPLSTTVSPRSGYVYLNYLGTGWMYRLLCRQNPPVQCYIIPERSTLVYGWMGDTVSMAIDTSATGLGTISVSSSQDWISARILEYATNTVEDNGLLTLQVTVGQNTGRTARNGTVTLTMACGGSFVTETIQIGQQSTSTDADVELSNSGIITDTHDVMDTDGNVVNSLEAGVEYHFSDTFPLQLDVATASISNGTVSVSGNAGKETVTFTPQLSNGATEGGGVISVETMDGQTVIYPYNVSSPNPAPNSRMVRITAGNGGLFTISVDNTLMTTERYEGRFNDGTAIRLTGVASDGYAFSTWTDTSGNIYYGATVVLTVDSSLVGADGYITYTASFVNATNLVTLTVNGGGGYITVGNSSTRYNPLVRQVNRGTTITNIEAHSGSAATFLKWSDGSTQNNRDYTVMSDTTLTPIYTGAGQQEITLDASGLLNADDYVSLAVNGTSLKCGIGETALTKVANGTYTIELECAINSPLKSKFNKFNHTDSRNNVDKFDNPTTYSYQVSTLNSNSIVTVEVVPCKFYFVNDNDMNYVDILTSEQSILLDPDVFKSEDITGTIRVYVTNDSPLYVALPVDWTVSNAVDDTGRIVYENIYSVTSNNGSWEIYSLDDTKDATYIDFEISDN